VVGCPVSGRAIPGNRWDLLNGVTPLEPPRVSVIVAHYAQPRELARTLLALRAQDHPADRLEIIVADDGSPEPPTVPPGVRLVRQSDEGFRLAAARNLGARHATGDVLLFLDADTAPEPGYVREMTRLPALAPDCVTVGRRRHADFAGVALDAPSNAGRLLPEPRWLADGYSTTRNLLDADDRSYRFVIGAVLACSRALFDVVGGWDESFTAYGGEDWEWAYRAWLRGAVLAHVPTAVAWHDGPDAAARGTDLTQKNAEAMRLADLIPLPGSRPRGRRPAAADVVVHGPVDASAAERFLSVDSALSALPGAEDADDPRVITDRVRVQVDLLRPVRVEGRGLADAVERLARESLGTLTLTVGGVDAVRITSERAHARMRRWRDDSLFASARAETGDLRFLVGEPDVEGYLGGWA
jgi:GT2 family glycosyltransferase